MLNETSSLARWALARPGASRVLGRHRLDYCCGGAKSLADACRERGLEPRAIVAELDAVPAPAGAIDWSTRPVFELADDIVKRYHDPLREELPRLLEMARKVERIHADRADCPQGLATLLEWVADDLFAHMLKEERVLFPIIRAGRGKSAGGPVAVMMCEHDTHGDLLARIRSLTTDHTPPTGACTTWRALYLGLAELEGELMEHIHLENNVLFPRALEAQ